jgi:5'-methylthioadenosine nucleosidase
MSAQKLITIQCAMRIEAAPIIETFSLQKIPSLKPHYPFEFYAGSVGQNLKVILGIAGEDPWHKVDSIGSVPATLLADVLVAQKPDLMINPGTAGGFQASNASLSEVYLGGPFACFHSRRSSVPGMDAMGLGNYPCAHSDSLSEALKIKQAIVSSGDALDYSKEDALYIKRNGAALKEMEAGAIGWICAINNVPFLPIKAITDFVDHPADTAEQFFSNYKSAVSALANKMKAVMSYLDENLKDKVWSTSD